VNAGQALNAADAHALTEGANNCDLLVAGEDIHGGPNPSLGGNGPRSGKLTRHALYCAEWSFSLGPNPGVDDLGPSLFPQ
jgi:hypothetical protein